MLHRAIYAAIFCAAIAGCASSATATPVGAEHDSTTQGAAGDSAEAAVARPYWTELGCDATPVWAVLDEHDACNAFQELCSCDGRTFTDFCGYAWMPFRSLGPCQDRATDARDGDVGD